MSEYDFHTRDEDVFECREPAISSQAAGTASVGSVVDASVAQQQELMNVDQGESGGVHDSVDHSSEHDLPDESKNTRCVGFARVVRSVWHCV